MLFRSLDESNAFQQPGNDVTIMADPTLGVNDPPKGTPREFTLHQNYPNPFNPSTEVRFDLPRDARVRLTVHTILGQEVARLEDGVMTAGSHTARWDASGLPSGVYLYRLRTAGFTETKKLTVIR